MLKALARFSKVIARYAYYPILIGFISLLSAIVNRGKPFAVLGWTLFGVCAVLSAISFLSGWLCKKAGIDDRIV